MLILSDDGNIFAYIMTKLSGSFFELYLFNNMKKTLQYRLKDHLLENFGVGYNSVEVKNTPIRQKPYINPFCETLLCFSQHHAEKDCEERWFEDTFFGFCSYLFIKIVISAIFFCFFPDRPTPKIKKENPLFERLHWYGLKLSITFTLF